MEESVVRDLLGAERETTLARISAMTSEFDEIVAAAAGSNGDDEHDPEGSTIAFERAQITALLHEARATLVEVDAALARLEDGSYGSCAHCGGPIAPERLAARPATRSCIECATVTRPAPNATV
jgi:RNA polymerase-binding transcription factor DksA